MAAYEFFKPVSIGEFISTEIDMDEMKTKTVCIHDVLLDVFVVQQQQMNSNTQKWHFTDVTFSAQNHR